MNSDGNVAVFSGTIEQGTGSPTVFAQLAAEILSLPLRASASFTETRRCPTRQ